MKEISTDKFLALVAKVVLHELIIAMVPKPVVN